MGGSPARPGTLGKGLGGSPASAGRRADFGSFPVAVRPKSGPEPINGPEALSRNMEYDVSFAGRWFLLRSTKVPEADFRPGSTIAQQRVNYWNLKLTRGMPK